MKIIASNIIKIENPDDDIKKYCKKELVFVNPDYAKKQHMGIWLGKTPKNITLYDVDSLGNYYLPVGCLNDIKGDINYNFITRPRLIDSNIDLRFYQKPCIKAIKEYNRGILIVPCGMGKTEMALEIASQLSQKTLFIAHTKDLVQQAYERCVEKMSCKTSFITDGNVDLTGDIVFATIQTLFKKLHSISQNEFGLVICDEVHHVAVNADSVGMFRECLDYFAANYKLGLTATLHRADGLEGCIPKIIGPVIYEICEDGNDYVGYFDGHEEVRFEKSQFQVPVKINFIASAYKIETENGFRDVFDKNGMTISFSKLLSDISLDDKRNEIIVNLANSIKGSTIILSDRVDQLKFFAKNIPNSVEIDGSTPKDKREQALKNVDSGKIRVLLASYKLAKEGLNIIRLSNIILATPIKDEAIVIQCIGRIQRPFEGKDIANVYDIIDDVSTLNRFYKKRKSIYIKKGWLK